MSISSNSSMVIRPGTFKLELCFILISRQERRLNFCNRSNLPYGRTSPFFYVLGQWGSCSDLSR